MQQTNVKGAWDKTQLNGESDPLGTMQETEIWTSCEMVYAQTRIPPRE